MMKRFLWIVTIALFVTTQFGTINAQDGELVSARIECGPWLQAVDETEFTVVWATNVKAIAWVEIAPDDGTHFYGIARPKFYESIHGRRPVGTVHTIKVTGLQKGTAYRYRIFQQALLLDEGNKRMIFGEAYGSDILRQLPFKTTTLDRSKPECHFSMVNDIHGNDSLFRMLTGNTMKSNNDFVIFNGDMLTQIESPEQIFDGYMRSAAELFSGNVPIFSVRGNHEYRGSASYDYMKYFPTSTGEPYYTFRQGPAFFIVLDGGEDKPDDYIRYYGLALTDRLREQQALWLEKTVASEEFRSAPVKIAVIHMPPGNDKEWYGRREITRLFMPILNNAGIDLMLCGHLHRTAYIEKGKEDNNFPILIHSNTTRADVSVTASGIKISVADASGKTVQTYQIGK